MPRSLTTNQKIAVRADHVIKAYLVRITLDSGVLRFALAGHDIKDANGTDVWLGAGRMASIEAIEEGVELEARGVRMSLSGVPPALVSAALSEPLANRVVEIFVAIYNAETYKMIDTPVLDWAGILDTMQVVTEPRKN